MDVNEARLKELEAMVRDNNRMLHSMRRRAYIGGVIKFIFYLLILVVAPLWIYATYVQPLMQGVSQTLDKAHNTGASVEAQFNALNDILKQVESKLPDFMRPKQ